MLSQLLQQNKGIVEISSQVTLLPALGCGLWLIAGRPAEVEE